MGAPLAATCLAARGRKVGEMGRAPVQYQELSRRVPVALTEPNSPSKITPPAVTERIVPARMEEATQCLTIIPTSAPQRLP